jgi:hypothetical protein
MRGAQPALGYVVSSGSSSKRTWSSSMPRPWLLLLCLGVGYWLGAHNSRVVPYQLDKVSWTGLGLHPASLASQQQQQQRGCWASVGSCRINLTSELGGTWAAPSLEHIASRQQQQQKQKQKQMQQQQQQQQQECPEGPRRVEGNIGQPICSAYTGVASSHSGHPG